MEGKENRERERCKHEGRENEMLRFYKHLIIISLVVVVSIGHSWKTEKVIPVASHTLSLYS